MHTELTVEEVLYYSAARRLPSKMKLMEKQVYTIVPKPL